jgi:cytochrome c-type biogenesis protein CcmH
MKSQIIAIVVTILVVGLSSYFVAGASGNAVDNSAVDNGAHTSAGSDTMNLGSVESMVGGLEDRLGMNPDDGKGWLLLAKSYRHLGRMDDARMAYKKAEGLGSGDATVAKQLFGLEGTEASQ